MALSLGLKIARALTQGRLADSATLGRRTQSLWDCRTTGLSGVPYGNGLAWNIRKALAEILAALDRRSAPRSDLNSYDVYSWCRRHRQSYPGNNYFAPAILHCGIGCPGRLGHLILDDVNQMDLL